MKTLKSKIAIQLEIYDKDISLLRGGIQPLYLLAGIDWLKDQCMVCSNPGSSKTSSLLKDTVSILPSTTIKEKQDSFTENQNDIENYQIYINQIMGNWIKISS